MKTAPHINRPQNLCLTTETLLAYAEGQIEGKAANAVERHLMGCPLCEDALEGIMSLGSTQEFTALLEEVDAKIESKKQTVSKPTAKKDTSKTITFTRVAAAITSIAAVILVVLMVLPAGPGSVASDYYATYEGIGGTRGGTRTGVNIESPTSTDVRSATEVTFDELMASYNSGEFQISADGFSAMAGSKAQFFAGNSFMELKQYDKAILAYQNVIALNDSFVSDARWYLGLAFLLNNDKVNGLKVMHEIKDSGSDYASKATEVLKKLE